VSESSPQEIIDIPALDRITEVLQIRDADSPDDARAAVISDLWQVRNMLVHGGDVKRVLVTEGSTDARVARLLSELAQLEMTSLGTTSARDVRARATADRVAEILLRHENYRADGANVPAADTLPAEAASGTVHDGDGGHHHELHQRIQNDAELGSTSKAAAAASPREIVSDGDAAWLGQKPDPCQAKTAPELVEALRAFRVWAGEPAYREMARRAAGRAAASTLHAALKRNHLPGLQVVTALVIGCGGTEEDQRQFTEAWQGIRLRQLSGLTELGDHGPAERALELAISRLIAKRTAPASKGEASA